MKLTDLHESKSQFFTTLKEVEAWTIKMYIRNCVINGDLSVDVNGSVDLENAQFEFLPVQFGFVDGYFDLSGNKKLTTLVGCPNQISTNFLMSNCKSLKSFEGITREIGGYLNCSGTKITSLKNIHKHIDHMTSFNCADSNIEGNVLGLLKIKGLRFINLTVKDQKVEEIICKYLPEGDILDCIDELTDAGFEEYAKL